MNIIFAAVTTVQLSQQLSAKMTAAGWQRSIMAAAAPYYGNDGSLAAGEQISQLRCVKMQTQHYVQLFMYSWLIQFFQYCFGVAVKGHSLPTAECNAIKCPHLALCLHHMDVGNRRPSFRGV